MKILFLTNLYPPHHRGGYGLLCQEVGTHLAARGHEVTVLTSSYGAADAQHEPGVQRVLRLQSDVYYYRPQRVLGYWSDCRWNRRAVDELWHEACPDVVTVWGMWNLSRRAAMQLEKLAGHRVVYYLADEWPAQPSTHEAYWDSNTGDSGLGRLFKRVLRVPVRLMLPGEWGPPRLGLQHVIVCSQSVRDRLVDSGVPVAHAKVIYHGIDPSPYRIARQAPGLSPPSEGLRIVYVGALLPHKGVHTVIEAVGLLTQEDSSLSISLDILGSGHPQYEAQLRAQVGQWDVGDLVTFRSPIPRAELPRFLARFDALVLPSVYEEPQARISQEAMAAGLVLVATQTGGTREILADGENGLAFQPEDARDLARQLRRLAEEPDLRATLTQSAWETVTARFTIDRMINALEAYLADVVDIGPSVGKVWV